jgi:rhamnulokinase
LFLRNITGLWLLQRLIVEWEQEGLSCDYAHLLSEGAKNQAFHSIVDSDGPAFTHPVSMRKAIQNECRTSGQAVPETQGELVRCVLQSLAWKYSQVMKQLEKVTQKNIKKLHIVGGGSQNELLNQLIADALNMEVIVGLTEATAVGNIIQQAIADRKISGWDEGHQMIKNSFTFRSYYPNN